MSPSAAEGATSSELATTGSDILRRQDQLQALEWLLAQRRMYSRAKRWNYVRVFGISIIALGAPIMTIVIPHSAEIVGAVAGGWIFLARTIFLARERRWARPAASVQDAFDVFVFGLPANPAVAPAPEHVADVIGDDDVAECAMRDNLMSWYSLDQNLPGAPAIAIAQQTNLAYSERLLVRHANVWLAIGAAWGLIAVVLGVAVHLSLSEFVMGVVLPVLPAVLDARELWSAARSAADDRSRLADALAARIRAWPSHKIELQELRSWQDQLYRLRRDGPLVPDFLYHWTRAKNERAMTARARELASTAMSH